MCMLLLQLLKFTQGHIILRYIRKNNEEIHNNKSRIIIKYDSLM